MESIGAWVWLFFKKFIYFIFGCVCCHCSAQSFMCSMISKKYSEFLPSMQSAQDLVTQVDKLSDDIGLLKSRIESEVRIVGYVG